MDKGVQAVLRVQGRDLQKGRPSRFPLSEVVLDLREVGLGLAGLVGVRGVTAYRESAEAGPGLRKITLQVDRDRFIEPLAPGIRLGGLLQGRGGCFLGSRRVGGRLGLHGAGEHKQKRDHGGSVALQKERVNGALGGLGSVGISSGLVPEEPMLRLEDRAWWSKLLAQKDDHSLRELAEMFEVTPGAINAALKRNGVQRKSAPSGPRVGKRASATGVPRGRGARPASEERLRPYASELGQVPDGEVAQKAGLSVATVARIRRSRGIPPAQRGVVDGSGASRIDPFLELLGRVPDAEVAALAGVTRAAVRNYRSRRNILSNAENRRRSVKAAAETAGADELTPTSVAFQVSLVDGRAGVILAESVVDAARRARSAGLKVTLVQRIGPILDA